MIGFERRHPGDVDATLRRCVPIWAGPLARVVAIALLAVDPAPGGVGDRRYLITTRTGLDEPREWRVIARWQVLRELRGEGSQVEGGRRFPAVPGEPDEDGRSWVVFLDVEPGSKLGEDAR